MRIDLLTLHRFNYKSHIFSFFYCTYVQQKMLGQIVFLSNPVFCFVRNRCSENIIAALIDNTYFTLICVKKLHYVTLGLLTNGNNPIGNLAGIFVFLNKNGSVDTGVQLRITHKNGIVHGDHCSGTCILNTPWKLLTKTVINIHGRRSYLMAHPFTSPN